MCSSKFTNATFVSISLHFVLVFDKNALPLKINALPRSNSNFKVSLCQMHLDDVFSNDRLSLPERCSINVIFIDFFYRYRVLHYL